MTKNQKEQFNRMRIALREISNNYMTPAQIKRDEFAGLDYEEYLETAYSNIQATAKAAVKGVREIKD